jgi:hypothetical protein
VAFSLRKSHLARHSTLHAYWKNALTAAAEVYFFLSSVTRALTFIERHAPLFVAAWMRNDASV